MKANQKRFIKIKMNQERVYLEYEVARENDTFDHYMVDSVDPPLPEFRQALLELRHSITDVCELGENYHEGLKVTGVSFSYTDNIMGAVVTGYKQVEAGGFVINTPHLASKPYARNAGNPIMPLEMVTRLDELTKQAHRFVNGERAQLEIFKKDDKKKTKAA